MSTQGHSSNEGTARRRPRTSNSTSHGLVLTACFVLFLIVCKLYLNQYIEIRKLEERLRKKQLELSAEKLKLDKMVSEVGFLGTLEGVEKIAREKLKYIKRDEVIIVPVGNN